MSTANADNVGDNNDDDDDEVWAYYRDNDNEEGDDEATRRRCAELRDDAKMMSGKCCAPIWGVQKRWAKQKTKKNNKLE